VLDEKVTDSGRLRSGEDAREIDFPASDVGNLPLAVHVLDVDERKASWVSIKIFDRVLTAFGDPVEIQLQFHQGSDRFRQGECRKEAGHLAE
jgi:hypothetical protein